MEVNLGFVLFAVLMAYLVVVRPILGLLRDRKASLASGEQAAKAEALFRATFPELQPHFHPARVADYVVARVEEGLRPVNGVIEKPPGFAAAARARVSGAPKGERTILEDAAGRRLAEFTLEKKDGALGALRLGAGKFTVRQKPGRAATVKYWHPEREFEWAPPAHWKFQTRLADDSISSSDRGTTWSDSSPSSDSTATAAAAFVGAGGAFDGGGASAGWEASGGADPSPPADSGATAGGDDSAASASGDDSATGGSGDASGGSSDDSSSTSY